MLPSNAIGSGDAAGIETLAYREEGVGRIKSALLAVVTPPNPSQAPITVARFSKMPLQN
jgi:hypothetical protein